MSLVTRTAHREHACLYGDTIQVGERYAEEIVAPWTLVADDVDEEGRTIGSKNGHWDHFRYHWTCRDQAEGR